MEWWEDEVLPLRRGGQWGDSGGRRLLNGNDENSEEKGRRTQTAVWEHLLAVWHGAHFLTWEVKQ